MPRNQRTLKSPAELEGVGLHNGRRVRVRLEPAPPGTGVVFQRADLEEAPDIPALAGNLSTAARRTVLRVGPAEIGMVEHLLSACHGLGVDNVYVRVDGEEMPGMDGSAGPYVKAIRRAGVIEQKVARKELVVNDPVLVRDNGAELMALPPSGEGLRVRYIPDYPPGIDAAPLAFELSAPAYEQDVAPARTFVLEAEVEQLLAAGYGKGATPENTLVLGGAQPPALRLEREPTRHKILDLLGDLGLLGADLKADILGIRSGHSLNHALVKELRGFLEARELAGDPAETGYDIDSVLRILPHRYPFLLVDRVIEVEGFRRAVGIKNVTINEPFFQGHFPGRPIMPGVLQLEAMAQVSGVLLQRKLEHTGKLVVLASIDKVRFRGAVVPGDTLRIEVETLKLSRSRASVQGVAKVGRRVVAEAQLSFAMLED
ncbi:MAG: UDP-3-O-[3-hydroxymyristoyl] N-acetylglucosamine deacetylase [Planctomycetota bacterium]|nr:MAG: UDP-3-O-[3-hydroxymyristoyl] N-acetylglucosamine deacetylase [Planctomycetota bacterium]